MIIHPILSKDVHRPFIVLSGRMLCGTRTLTACHWPIIRVNKVKAIICTFNEYPNLNGSSCMLFIIY